MIGAPSDAVAALAGGLVSLAVIVVVWLILHHARPELKVDIGIRGWITMRRPPPDGPGSDDTGASAPIDGPDAPPPIPPDPHG